MIAQLWKLETIFTEHTIRIPSPAQLALQNYFKIQFLSQKYFKCCTDLSAINIKGVSRHHLFSIFMLLSLPISLLCFTFQLPLCFNRSICLFVLFVKIAMREQFLQNTVGVSYGGIWKETNQNNNKKQFQALK